MNDQKYSNTITASLTIRRSVRAMLDVVQAEWIEHRGWFESTFVIIATREQWEHIELQCASWGFPRS